MKKTILALLLLVCTLACTKPAETKNKGEVVKVMAQQTRQKNNDVSAINVQEYINKTRSPIKLVLVDVRSEKEQAISMIPGAITQKEFETKQDEYKNYQVITYCTIGGRAANYARSLQEQGVRSFFLEGSILSWAHHGLEFEKDGQKTKKVHVNSKAWNLLPEGYQGVY